MRGLATIVCLLMIVPATLFGQSFSGGLSHTLYLCANGEVFSWGDNSLGQLGIGVETPNTVTPLLISKLQNIVQVDAGECNFSLARDASGNVWAWGSNDKGQLGNGTFCIDSASATGCDVAYSPIMVSGGQTGNRILSNVKAIAAGYEHSMALLDNGEVVTWGNNTFGQLGNGTTNSMTTPVYVLKPDSTRLNDIISIDAGAFFCLAISSDGKVWGWGKNTSDELGCGNDTNQFLATRVLLPNKQDISSVKSVSGGLRHALFLSYSGEVYGTGAYLGATHYLDTVFYKLNKYAQIVKGGEQGNTTLRDVVTVEAGMTHSLALAKTGTSTEVFSWGDNRFLSISTTRRGGQLGVGSSDIAHSLWPRRMVNSVYMHIANATGIFATVGDSYVLSNSDKTGANIVYACGVNDVGQLGTMDYTDRFSAAKILAPICGDNCPTAYLGDNRAYCLPLQDTLNSGYVDSRYKYSWYKNDTLVAGEAKPFLPIDDTAKYTLSITDTQNVCPAAADEIYISSKKRPFTLIPTTFCEDTVPFKVFGNQTFNWYSKRLSGVYLASGSSINVPIRNLAGKLSDTVKTVWLYTKECQPLPVQALKYCDSCSLAPPTPYYMPSYCRNNSGVITCDGRNIKWYDSLMNLVSVSDTLCLTMQKEGTFTYHATQSDDFCESPPAPVSFSVASCEERYVVSGKIIPGTTGRLTVYDVDHMPAILGQATVSVSGNYSLKLPRSTVVLQFVPLSTSLYSTTYFGNTTLLEHAYILDVNANVGGADISLKTKDNAPLPGVNEIEIYPNIVKSVVRIRYPGAHNDDLSVKIIDMRGLMCKRFSSVAGNPCAIDVSDLNPGLYYVVAATASTSAAGIFIKQ